MELLMSNLVNFNTYLTDPEILSLIGTRFREWRISKELTQKEVIECTGVSRGAIQRLEAGGSVDLSTFVSIIRSLDLVDNLNLFLPLPEPTIESLKEIRNTVTSRRRVRKKNG
jgi:transcriptional regulator with XRE-family HTH domain